MEASRQGRISAGKTSPFPDFNGVGETTETVGIASWFMSAMAARVDASAGGNRDASAGDQATDDVPANACD
jgi:hypothetical protein